MTDPVRDAVRATYAAFGGCGFAAATFTARLPQIREHLHLSTGQLGVILLAAAAGALAARPFARRVVARLGQRGTVAAMAVVFGTAQAAVGVPAVPALVAGLLLMGFGGAGWDLAMNIQGALVEQRYGRSIMPRFHAGYSIGTVAGALTGTVLVLLRVPVVVHMVGTGLLVAILVPLAVRGFLPDTVYDDTRATRSGRALAFWREPRTILIGLFVLAFGFGEGAGNDWIGVGTVGGYHATALVGTLAYATFLAATTATRWFGARLLDRFGRVTVLRICSVLAAVGVALFATGFAVAGAFVGIALWGVGTSFGYPVGMSAAADDPRYAAERVTVASTIGKVAAFAGPPLLGLLGDNVTILRALIVVAVLQLVAAAIAGATRRPPVPVAPLAAPDTASA